MVAHSKMVSLVREAKGWTQKRLSDEASLSQGFLSKVESGLVPLQDESLRKVASALDCVPALLISDLPVRGLEVTCMHHRRRSSTMNVGTRRKIEALTHLTRVSVEGLLHGIELEPETHLQRIDIRELEDATEIARQVRIAWRIPSGPIRSVIRLIESLGVIVVVRPLGTAAQDAACTWPHDTGASPLMLLNSGLAPDRQRFTAAHELGHLVMHAIPGDDQEREADQFASELLAPAHEIEPQLQGLTSGDFPRLLELKAHWGISVAALIRRAHDLNVISDRQYREFQIRLNRLGWRTLEPGTLTLETPTSLNRVISVHLDEHQYSISELAQAAVMTEAAFRRHYLPSATTDPPPWKLTLVSGDA